MHPLAHFILPAILILAPSAHAKSCDATIVPDGMPFGIELCKTDETLQSPHSDDMDLYGGNVPDRTPPVSLTLKDGSRLPIGDRIVCVVHPEAGRCTLVSPPSLTVNAGPFSLLVTGETDVGFSTAHQTETATVLNGKLASGEAQVTISGGAATIETTRPGEEISLHLDGSLHCGFLKSPARITLDGMPAEIQSRGNIQTGYFISQVWDFGDFCAYSGGALEQGALSGPTRLHGGRQELLLAAGEAHFFRNGTVSKATLAQSARFQAQGQSVEALPGEVEFYENGALKFANVHGGGTFQLAPIGAHGDPASVTIPPRTGPYGMAFGEDGILKAYGIAR